MKKQNLLAIAAFALWLVVAGQSVFMQEVTSSEDNFDKMTFVAETNKSEYLPLEPIGVKFRFINKTTVPLNTLPPSFNRVMLRVTPAGGKTREFPQTSLILSDPVRFTRAFNPGETVQQEVMLITFLDKFFPAPGDYQIQFVLPSGVENVNSIKSSLINLRIKEPTGADKQALELLRRNQAASEAPDELFRWSHTQLNDSGRTLLEAFVDKFGYTAYGEYAVYNLANFYLHFRNDPEKAKYEFEKLRGSENKAIANEANRSLSLIQRNEEMEKLKKSQ